MIPRLLLLAIPVLFGMVFVSLRIFEMPVQVVVPGWTPGDSEEDRAVEDTFEVLRELDVVLERDDPEPLPPTDTGADGTRGRLPHFAR